LPSRRYAHVVLALHEALREAGVHPALLAELPKALSVLALHAAVFIQAVLRHFVLQLLGELDFLSGGPRGGLAPAS